MNEFILAIFTILLMVSGYFDLKYRRIPNKLILIGIIPLLFKPNIFTLNAAVIALVSGLLLNRIVGAGDIKLAFLITSYTNLLSFSQLWIYFALVSGGLFALISRKSSIPFAPFMGIGVAIAYLARAQSII